MRIVPWRQARGRRTRQPPLLVDRMRVHHLFAIAENDDEKDPEAKTVLREVFAADGLPAEIEVCAGTLHGWCPPDSDVYNQAQAERTGRAAERAARRRRLRDRRRGKPFPLRALARTVYGPGGVRSVRGSRGTGSPRMEPIGTARPLIAPQAAFAPVRTLYAIPYCVRSNQRVLRAG